MTNLKGIHDAELLLRMQTRAARLATLIGAKAPPNIIANEMSLLNDPFIELQMRHPTTYRSTLEDQ